MWKRQTNIKGKNEYLFVQWMHALCIEIGKYAHWKDSNFSIFVFSIGRHMHYYYYYSFARYTVVAEIKGVHVLNVASSLCEGAAFCSFFRIFYTCVCVCCMHVNQRNCILFHFDRMLQFHLHTSASPLIIDVAVTI